MSAADDLYGALGKGVARAQVLTEAAEVAEQFAERWPDWDAMRADGIIGPFTAFGAVADELRRMAGTDTEDGAQPPAGETTQPGPDLHSIVHTALNAVMANALLPAHTVRHIADRITAAVAPLVPYRPVWDPALPPGGYVCNICGEPVESEPCREHAPADGEASEAPVGCRKCGDTAGPWDPETGLCETCLPGGAR